MSDEDRSEQYGIVMPFLPVVSKGGTYEDDAYVAGYEMGLLDAHLEAKPKQHEVTIHAANAEQADLIAMRNGYTCTLLASDDYPDWKHAVFTPMSEGPA